MPHHCARSKRMMTQFAVIFDAGWIAGADQAGVRAQALSVQKLVYQHHWPVDTTGIGAGVRACARA